MNSRVGRTWQNRAGIGFARFWRLAPPEPFSGYVQDRKWRVHARFPADSPDCGRPVGLEGGA
jgi:hypothetical protein